MMYYEVLSAVETLYYPVPLGGHNSALRCAQW